MRSLHRGQTDRRLAAAAGGLLLVLLATIAPAGAVPAHGGGGQITLVRAEATGPFTVAVEVCVTFTLDRDQADTARVVLGATGPGDLEVPAETMGVGDQPGLRTGELTFPEVGSWTVQVTSTFPPAELAVPVTVDGERPEAAITSGPQGGPGGPHLAGRRHRHRRRRRGLRRPAAAPAPSDDPGARARARG